MNEQDLPKKSIEELRDCYRQIVRLIRQTGADGLTYAQIMQALKKVGKNRLDIEEAWRRLYNQRILYVYKSEGQTYYTFKEPPQSKETSIDSIADFSKLSQEEKLDKIIDIFAGRNRKYLSGLSLKEVRDFLNEYIQKNPKDFFTRYLVELALRGDRNTELQAIKALAGLFEDQTKAQRLFSLPLYRSFKEAEKLA